MQTWRILPGDVRASLAMVSERSVQTCITSPPYWGLRDYGHAGQLGLETTPAEYVAAMVEVFAAVWRVLRDDGTLWLNIGDSYAGSGRGGNPDAGTKQGTNAGSQTVGVLYGRENDDEERARILAQFAAERAAGLKPKDLVGIPWMVAFALRDYGWYLRSDIIWHKPNPMPESVTDRPTKSHEYLFLLTKSARYYYDAEAIKEPASRDESGNKTRKPATARDCPRDGVAGSVPWAGDSRNRRSVWTVPTQPFSDWTKTVRRVRVAPGDADGDTKRTTSPDCPVHGDRSALVASALYGEREADASSRTAHTAGLVQEPLFGSAPTAMSLGVDSVTRSSDLPRQSSASSATGRSTQSRRTGRAPATTSPCSVSARTPPHTGGTSTVLVNAEPCDHTSESRTGLAASGAHLSAQTIDRIAHTVSSVDSCTCELYKEITEEMSHFATYPEDLIEPCILAGSKPGDLVLDPFTGSGTTGAVAIRHGRNFLGCELNPTYIELARKRIGAVAPLLAREVA